MMMDISRTTLGIAAGVAGTLFLGYCIYFDNKRRSDPEYKKKVRDRKCSPMISLTILFWNLSLHINIDVLFRFSFVLLS